MPPQVGGAGPAKRPVVVQPQNGVDKTKSNEVEKKPSREPQNATKSSGSHRATPKEKSQKNTEAGIMGSVQKIALDELIKAEEGNTVSQKGKSSSSIGLRELAKVLGELEDAQAKKLQR